MTNTLTTDLLVIGWGKGGKTLATKAAKAGRRVVMVERDPGMVGGACITWRASPPRRLEEQESVTVVMGEAEFVGPRRVAVEAVLFATGRVPVVPAGVETAGIELDEKGWVKVDDLLRTSADGVWAVGDVNGGPQFTYISLDDYRIVASQILGDDGRSVSDRVAVPTTTFLTPPYARVGLTEKEAREQGLDIKVATKPVAKIAMMPRPKAVGETRGVVKVVGLAPAP